MSLPLDLTFAPMEALAVDEIPEGDEWQYEPKWDGFRCLVFRDGATVELRSKAGQPLTRYFPDVAEAALALDAPKFVLDGELVIPADGTLSFDELLLRIHPAASRVNKLVAEHPATLIVFDLLVDDAGRSLVDEPLVRRRERLEAFAAAHFPAGDRIRLSPVTSDARLAQRWLGAGRGGLDGVMAKRADYAYRSGDRTGMQKIKRQRTAECVIGGFRYATNKRVVGSFLLGLYDPTGLLHHVGFTSSFTAAQRAEFTPKLEPLIGAPGFTGQAPGGPSRWSTKRSSEWEPLLPKLVVEVQYDHFTGGRFRHGARFLRWRPDKLPRMCTIDQIETGGESSLQMLK